MDTINLSKGGSIDLSKAAPAVTRFMVGLGWYAGSNFDLDVSAFPCKINASGDPVLLSPPQFVFYGNLESKGPDGKPDGGLIHTGDNLTGDGDGDDEMIMIDTSKLDPTVQEIDFICTLHDAVNRGQTFGKVKDSYIRICEVRADGKPGHEIARYKLGDDAADSTAVQFGALMKKGDHWDFEAVGAGFKADLATIVKQYTPGTTVTA